MHPIAFWLGLRWETAFQYSLRQWPTPVGFFPGLQVLGQARPVAEPSDGNRCFDATVVRYVEHGSRPIDVEPGHCMRVPSGKGRLQRQIGPRRPGIERVGTRHDWVLLTGWDERLFRHHNEQGSRVFRPRLVTLA